MPTLLESLADSKKRKSIIDECVVLIDQEVADKGGLGGLAIKAGYKVVKGVKPGFVAEAVDGLLDDFCKQLQPIADEAGREGTPVGKHFAANRARVADALLAITDGRATRSRHTVVKGAYEKLRSSAKRNVEDAVPRLGALVERHHRV
jgi:hypothetical protein